MPTLSPEQVIAQTAAGLLELDRRERRQLIPAFLAQIDRATSRPARPAPSRGRPAPRKGHDRPER